MLVVWCSRSISRKPKSSSSSSLEQEMAELTLDENSPVRWTSRFFFLFRRPAWGDEQNFFLPVTVFYVLLKMHFFSSHLFRIWIWAATNSVACRPPYLRDPKACKTSNFKITSSVSENIFWRITHEKHKKGGKIFACPSDLPLTANW